MNRLVNLFMDWWGYWFMDLFMMIFMYYVVSIIICMCTYCSSCHRSQKTDCE
ncbi:hypothetical protein [Methanosarcina sp. UBA5]|uniref:hypothetical protein n=1 Tax=Methanosarcina sp. UBA5 TaxID=1915593 RepID=UPI0025E8B88A|nr:hypothetical protein [Methanosarcina sp. UBA5]